MVVESPAFSHLLSVLTESQNRPARQALVGLTSSHISTFQTLYLHVLKSVSVSREEVEGQLSLLMTLRLLWRLVPRRLIEGLDPNYERLAEVALQSEFGGPPSPELVRKLAVVFRRVRSSRVEGRDVTGLDLGRGTHAALLKSQDGRCALCGYIFSVTDLYSADETDLSYFEEAYRAYPGEIYLARYVRRPALDHIIPYFLGGDGPENWQILCQTCNAGKGESLSWISRKGWMPPTRLGDVVALTPALRYSVLARHRTNECATSLVGNQILRIFLRDPGRLILMENLTVRAA